MFRPLVTSFLVLALAASAFAAGEAPAKAKRAAVAPESERPPAAGPGADLPARTVFQVLLGEIALQRGDNTVALGSYTDLARRTRDPQVIARAAEIAAALRQFDLAHDLAELWLQVEPDSQRARQAVASSLVLLNRVEELAPQLATILEQDQANLGANLLRLNHMFARQTDKGAVQRLVNRLAQPYVGIAEAHFAMATAAANAGDHPRALAEIARALDLRPDWEMAALLRAQLEARLSAIDAIADLTAFVGRNAEAKDARLTLARLLLSEKRYGEARPHFDRLLPEFPDRPEVVYPAAMLALQQNDFTTGKKLLEKLLTGDFPDKGSLHFFLGQIDEEQKNPDGALAHYRQVLGGDQLVPARVRTAQLLAQRGQGDEAQRVLGNTTGASGDEQTQLLQARAQLLREAKQIDEAYALLADALRAQPDNTELLYDAALLAERLGKIDILEAHLKHLLQLRPNHAHGLNALGYSLADRNLRLDEAHDLVARALTLAPDDPFILDSMGWVLFRQGRLGDALKTLETAYSKKADPEIAAHLGEVLWQMNRRDDARRVLIDAARKFPGSDELTATIKKLQI